MAQHKKTQPGSKRSKRSKDSYQSRRNSTKGQRGKPRKRFLIVCEGTETEPNYFEALGRKIKTKVNLVIKGAGRVSLSLVEEAKRLKDKDGGYEVKSGDDEVWCVFDRDFKSENNNQNNFNRAISLACQNNINLALSNDAFELWFLLHYSYYDSETHRKNLIKMLDDKMDKKYSKISSEQYYEELEHLLPQAIKHAEKLWNSYDEQIELSRSELATLIKKHNINPSTTVYQLMNKLMKYLD
ncbi:MAG: RloB family protein [Cyanobacteria bacterium J06648_1]